MDTSRESTEHSVQRAHGIKNLKEEEDESDWDSAFDDSEDSISFETRKNLPEAIHCTAHHPIKLLNSGVPKGFEGKSQYSTWIEPNTGNVVYMASDDGGAISWMDDITPTSTTTTNDAAAGYSPSSWEWYKEEDNLDDSHLGLAEQFKIYPIKATAPLECSNTFRPYPIASCRVGQISHNHAVDANSGFIPYTQSIKPESAHLGMCSLPNSQGIGLEIPWSSAGMSQDNSDMKIDFSFVHPTPAGSYITPEANSFMTRKTGVAELTCPMNESHEAYLYWGPQH